MSHSSPFTSPGEAGEMSWLLTVDCCWIKSLLQACPLASTHTGCGANWISLGEPPWKHCGASPSSLLMETDLRALSSTTELNPLKRFKTRQGCVSHSNSFKLGGITLAALLEHLTGRTDYTVSLPHGINMLSHWPPSFIWSFPQKLSGLWSILYIILQLSNLEFILGQGGNGKHCWLCSLIHVPCTSVCFCGTHTCLALPPSHCFSLGCSFLLTGAGRPMC